MQKYKTIILIPLLLLFAFWIALARPWFVISEPIVITEVIDTNHLEQQVKTLSEDFLPRDAANPQNLKRAADFIKSDFEKYSQNVKYQYYEVNNNQYQNVIATFGPKTESSIVIGAHYDAYSHFPGADDNASGVVGLMEIARLISELELTKQIELVAYTLEEPPYFSTQFMGSAVHARSLKENDRKIELMISLEMIGYFTDEKDSQNYPIPALRAFYPDQGNFVAVIDLMQHNKAQAIKNAINQHTDLDAYSMNSFSFIPGVDFSDHRNYWNEGYPAVMVTDTAFYRNFHYHEATDTYDRLDYDKMAKVIFGVFKYIEKLSGD